MPTFSRRQFLLFGGGTLAAGALMAPAAANPSAPAKSPAEPVHFPEQRVCRLSQLEVGKPLNFSYPDPESLCAVVRLGRRTENGVGPEGDVVAFSTLCPHMGCGLRYSPESRCFKCPCHFSIFDCELGGAQVCGQSARPLARIVLAWRPEEDTLRAVGVEGTLYGRAATLEAAS